MQEHGRMLELTRAREAALKEEIQELEARQRESDWKSGKKPMKSSVKPGVTQ